MPLAHLDRPFDYLVRPADDEVAQPGVRVKVRFAGQLVDGFLLDRRRVVRRTAASWPTSTRSSRPSRSSIRRSRRLARAVADRYAGNLCDVLRLAVPPRHARVEAQSPRPPGGEATQAASDVTQAAGDQTHAAAAGDQTRRGGRRAGRAG